MKVKELIEELLKHDQEAEVLVDAYEMGVNDLRQVVAATAYRNVDRPYWYGRYEMTKPGMYTSKNAEPINVVYLPRLDHVEAIDE